MAILPWDYDGSPCREAYNGQREKNWADYHNEIDACPHVGECILTSCLISKYTRYLNKEKANEIAYTNCIPA